MRRLFIAAAVTGAFFGLPSGARADDVQVQRGMAVYAAQKCSVCHSVAGVGNKKNPLDGVGTKLSADDIREWVTHPKEAAAKAKSTAKPLMKAYATLPPADLDALVAYLKTLTKK